MLEYGQAPHMALKDWDVKWPPFELEQVKDLVGLHTRLEQVNQIIPEILALSLSITVLQALLPAHPLPRSPRR